MLRLFPQKAEVQDGERHPSLNCLTTVNSPRRAGSCAQRDITSHLVRRQGFCQEQAPGDKSGSVFMTLA